MPSIIDGKSLTGMLIDFIICDLIKDRAVILVLDSSNENTEVLNLLEDHLEHLRMVVLGCSERAKACIIEKRPRLILLNLDTIEDSFLFYSHARVQLFHTYFIGITADPLFGLRAFKVGFSDVLLMPVSRVDMEESLSKFELHLKNQFVLLKNYREHIYLRPKEVLYLKGDNNTTEIYLKNGEVVHSFKTLKTVQATLPAMFVRIQKGFIINTQHLYHYDSGKKICRLRGVSINFPFSRKYIPNVRLLEQKILQVEK